MSANKEWRTLGGWEMPECFCDGNENAFLTCPVYSWVEERNVVEAVCAFLRWGATP